MLLRFSLKHLWRHARLQLLLLALFLLTTGLLAGLPMVAAAIAGRNLQQRLADATPAARNMLVEGNLSTRLQQTLQDGLGSFYGQRLRLRSTGRIPATPQIQGQDGAQRQVQEILFLRFWSLDLLHNAVKVEEGRMPAFVAQSNPLKLPTLEVAVGREAAALYGLNLGDQLASADGTYTVEIVGILSPLDPQADLWWGDLLPFGLQRLPGGNLPDTIILSLWLPPQSMEAYASFSESWRVLLRWDRVNLANAGNLRASLETLRSQETAVQLKTSLGQIIAAQQEQLATARVTLFLLTGQSLLFALYVLTLAGHFFVGQAWPELVTLAGRGFSAGQITLVFALEGGVVSFLLAAPLGPWLAHRVVGLWAAQAQAPLPAAISLESRLLALAAAGLGWLSFTLSTALATRRNLVHWQQRASRPPGRTWWQRQGFDLILGAVGAAAYWQLGQRGSFILRSGEEAAADPLLLLGPSLLLIALALLLLRLFPWLMRLLAWLARRMPALSLPLSLTRLARDPTGPAQVVLLVTMAAGLSLFAGAFSSTLARQQQAYARYFTGGDLRLKIAEEPDEAAAQEQALAALPGVAATQAYRVRAPYGFEPGKDATLLAIEPNSIAQTVAFPPGASSVTLAQIGAALAAYPQERWAEAVPALFSVDTVPEGTDVGDRFIFIVGTNRVTFETRGLIAQFPSLSAPGPTRPFFVALLPALAQQVDLSQVRGRYLGDRELWLSFAPARREAVLAALPPGVTVLRDSQDQRQSLVSNLVAQQTAGAFSLNALVLVSLSLLTFLAVHFLDARRRLFEFGWLRAEGATAGQLLVMLALEGLVSVGAGLLLGTAVGLGLTQAMRPFLGLALAEALGGGPLPAIAVDWVAVGRLYGLLLAGYLLGLLLVLAALLRAGIHRTLRLGDE